MPVTCSHFSGRYVVRFDKWKHRRIFHNLATQRLYVLIADGTINKALASDLLTLTKLLITLYKMQYDSMSWILCSNGPADVHMCGFKWRQYVNCHWPQCCCNHVDIPGRLRHFTLFLNWSDTTMCWLTILASWMCVCVFFILTILTCSVGVCLFLPAYS